MRDQEPIALLCYETCRPADKVFVAEGKRHRLRRIKRTQNLLAIQNDFAGEAARDAICLPLESDAQTCGMNIRNRNRMVVGNGFPCARRPLVDDSQRTASLVQFDTQRAILDDGGERAPREKHHRQNEANILHAHNFSFPLCQ